MPLCWATTGTSCIRQQPRDTEERENEWHCIQYSSTPFTAWRFRISVVQSAKTRGVCWMAVVKNSLTWITHIDYFVLMRCFVRFTTIANNQQPAAKVETTQNTTKQLKEQQLWRHRRTLPVGAWSWDRAVARCSREGRQVVPGGPRTSRALNGPVAREWGNIEYEAPRIRCG